MNGYIARFFIEFLEQDCFFNYSVIAFYGTASPFFDGGQISFAGSGLKMMEILIRKTEKKTKLER